MKFSGIDSKHRELLDELIQKLESVDYAFYKESSRWNYWAWHILAGTAFLCSLVSTLLAAFINDEMFRSFGKILLVIVPTIGTGASGLLTLYKFREKEELREHGRIEMEDIILCAKSRRHTANSEVQFKETFDYVRMRAKTLNESQHIKDVALRANSLDITNKNLKDE